MNRGLSAVLIAGLALAAPGGAQAVQLVSASGGPVAGQWQHWADGSKMPTVQMGVTLTTSATAPGTCAPPDAPACVWHMQTKPLIWVAASAANPRFDVYHELGHLFDWYYLSDRDRHQWEVWSHARGKRWAERGTPNGGPSDGFADDYAWCAAFPFPRIDLRWLNLPQARICRLILHARYHDTPGAFATGAVPY